MSREEDAYVIERMGKLLAEIAIVVNGPEPPLTRWSYHDLPEKVRALKQAPPAAAVPSLASVLDAYEQQTKALPCQHEIPERGCSTYNWQTAVIRDLRAMLAAAERKRGES